jgi:hypothetical protein
LSAFFFDELRRSISAFWFLEERSWGCVEMLGAYLSFVFLQLEFAVKNNEMSYSTVACPLQEYWFQPAECADARDVCGDHALPDVPQPQQEQDHQSGCVKADARGEAVKACYLCPRGPLH